MQTAIRVTLKDVYGVTKAYPACEQAQRLADVAGTKTLTCRTLELARSMGFTLTYVDRFGSQSPVTNQMLSLISG